MVLSDLQTLFTDWLDRSDLSPTELSTFLNRGLARIHRECRLPCMEKSVRAIPDLQGNLSSLGVPWDFLQAQRFEADGTFLQMVTPEFLLGQTGTPTTMPAFNNTAAYIVPSVLVGAPPQFVARVGGSFRFVPYPQSYAVLYYWGQFPSLRAPTDSNALLDVSPELWVFAALSYAGDMFRMDETEMWEQRYQEERDMLQQVGQDADTAGPMIVQASYNGGYL